MTGKSLFREMSQKVHPDHSTHSEHSSAAKMREVLKHRNEPEVLLALAQRWGLQLDGSFDEFAFNQNSEKFAGFVFEAVVGAIIQHTFVYRNAKDNKGIHGVIINTRKVTKGHRRGATEFKIYDFETGVIWTLKTYEKQPFNKIVGMADDSVLKIGKDRLDTIVNNKKEVNKIRQNNADSHFSRLGLGIGKNYENSGIHVLVEYKGGTSRWHKLLKTTPKSVYIPNGFKSRRIPVSCVLRVKTVA